MLLRVLFLSQFYLFLKALRICCTTIAPQHRVLAAHTRELCLQAGRAAAGCEAFLQGARGAGLALGAEFLTALMENAESWPVTYMYTYIPSFEC